MNHIEQSIDVEKVKAEWKKSKEDEIILWGLKDDEVLSCDSLDEYVSHYISDYEYDLPKSIEVVGFKRGKVSKEFAEKASEELIESLHEWLMEEYGYEDEIPLDVDAVEKLKTATAEICDKFVPWTCEPVKTVNVDIEEWMKENEL